MEMFGMFGGNLAKVFDFDKIDLQKKKQEFVQLVFFENARTSSTTPRILLARIRKKVT